MEIVITLGGFVVLFLAIKGLRNSVEELARSVRGIEGRFEPAN